MPGVLLANSTGGTTSALHRVSFAGGISSVTTTLPMTHAPWGQTWRPVYATVVDGLTSSTDLGAVGALVVRARTLYRLEFDSDARGAEQLVHPTVIDACEPVDFVPLNLARPWETWWASYRTIGTDNGCDPANGTSTERWIGGGPTPPGAVTGAGLADVLNVPGRRLVAPLYGTSGRLRHVLVADTNVRSLSARSPVTGEVLGTWGDIVSAQELVSPDGTASYLGTLEGSASAPVWAVRRLTWTDGAVRLSPRLVQASAIPATGRGAIGTPAPDGIVVALGADVWRIRGESPAVRLTSVTVPPAMNTPAGRAVVIDSLRSTATHVVFAQRTGNGAGSRLWSVPLTAVDDRAPWAVQGTATTDVPWTVHASSASHVVAAAPVAQAGAIITVRPEARQAVTMSSQGFVVGQVAPRTWTAGSVEGWSDTVLTCDVMPTGGCGSGRLVERSVDGNSAVVLGDLPAFARVTWLGAGIRGLGGIVTAHQTNSDGSRVENAVAFMPGTAGSLRVITAHPVR